ncbi:hypothetical protein, partial [Parafrankia soli]|uniref:hypothetical protein n=1 Tax=Parafrankia soli TaxID=2599596 RepID=UPI00104253FF
MTSREARPDVEGDLEVFREATGRRWWRIRLADPPNDTGWHFCAYLHRKADGVALRTLILDACPGRDFAALFTPTSGVSAEERAAIDGRIRHLERVARLVWDRRNRGACIRCGERHEGDHREGRKLLSEADVAWAAPVRAASSPQASAPAPPDVEGGLEILKWERAWLVRAMPIAGRWAAFGSANRKRDARAL